MATKKTNKPQVNEVTITKTIKITSIVKLPTNDETAAQKAIDKENTRIAKALSKLGVDDYAVAEEKTFLNLAE